MKQTLRLFAVYRRSSRLTDYRERSPLALALRSGTDYLKEEGGPAVLLNMGT